MQMTSQIKQQILNDLAQHKDEVAGYKNINKRMRELARIGIFQYEEQFTKTFPKEKYPDVSVYFHENELESGKWFFLSAKNLEFLHNILTSS